MNDFLQQFVQQLIATSLLEWLAVLLAIGYLLLAIKESLWCWPAAFFSTGIYIYLFFDANLYMESFLNFYYLIMAIYGFKQWNNKGDSEKEKAIIVWPMQKHLLFVFIAAGLVFLSYSLLSNYTDQDFALLDSFTTWFAILATYMLTQKVLENWLYWILINAAAIYIYLAKGFALTAVLFFSYILLAVIGWRTWKKHYEQQTRQPS